MKVRGIPAAACAAATHCNSPFLNCQRPGGSSDFDMLHAVELSALLWPSYGVFSAATLILQSKPFTLIITLPVSCICALQFNGVLENVSQETVYSSCAHDAVDSVLSGFNACVFCYGQVSCTSIHTAALCEQYLWA